MSTQQYEIGDRVEVLHNTILGNLIGTVTAIHYNTYEVTLDGGGKDNLFEFQIKRLTKAPETMEVDDVQRVRDGTPVCETYWVMMNHAEEMEIQRNEARAFIKRQQDALKWALPWMSPCGVSAEIEKCIMLADEFNTP